MVKLLHCKFSHDLWSEVLCMVVGDAEYNFLSPFCMEELVGEIFFKCLEYGAGLSYVVNLEGT